MRKLYLELAHWEEWFGEQFMEWGVESCHCGSLLPLLPTDSSLPTTSPTTPTSLLPSISLPRITDSGPATNSQFIGKLASLRGILRRRFDWVLRTLAASESKEHSKGTKKHMKGSS